MVVPSHDALTVLTHRSATEFATPDDDGVLEESPLLETRGSAPPWDGPPPGSVRKRLAEIRPGASMVVPVGVVLDEPGSSLHQTAGQETVVGE